MKEIRTDYDDEIAALETARLNLEAEKNDIQNGHFKMVGVDGQNVEIDLSGIEDPKQSLAQNPIVQELVFAFKSRQQIAAELLLTSQIQMTTKQEDGGDSRETTTTVVSEAQNQNKLGLGKKMLLANYRLNQAAGGKSNTFGRILASGEIWIVAGVAILLLWCGLPLIYAFTGGAIGGTTSNTNSSSSSNPNTSKMTTITINSSATSSAVVAKTPSPDSILSKNGFDDLAGSYSYIPADAKQQQMQQATATGRFNATATPTPSQSPTTTTVGSGKNNAATTQATITTFTTTTQTANTDNSNSVVGNPAIPSGGANGPHGAFLAPSRMQISSIGVDAQIKKAITLEEPPAATTTITDTTTSTSTQEQPQLEVEWPSVADGVVQYGSFPGETGNLILMANAESLNALRHLQIGDIIKITDRDGNTFYYRALPFSATGQPERVVDTSNPQDNWIWQQTQDMAVLTIIVTVPQSQSQLAAIAAAAAAQNQNQAQQPQQTPPAGNEAITTPIAHTDATTTKKLAYRAVLAIWNATTATPIGTMIDVPAAAWQTQPAAATTTNVAATVTTGTSAPTTPSINTTTTTAATPTINPNSSTSLPSLPDTGKGGLFRSQTKQ